MDVVGLFVGIGGIEIGIDVAGNTPIRFCEVMPEARSVLAHNFPGIAINKDVRKMVRLPKADILAAGFPCQNLSIAGKKEGICGKNSSLVNEIFWLIENNYRPRYVVIENVANLTKVSQVAMDLHNLTYNRNKKASKFAQLIENE